LSKSHRRERLRREEIIDAAISSFYQHGYAETTLATVAQHLDVTDKALYHYFESKDDLYLECLNTCTDRVAALIASINESGDPGLARVKIFASTLIRQTDNLLPYARKLPAHLENRPLGVRFRETQCAHNQACIAWIKAGISDGSIRPADPEVLWRWNIGALVWLGIWSPDGVEKDDAFREFLARQAVAMLDRSLGLNGEA
jgi:AcrR family transcriptional regulator